MNNRPSFLAQSIALALSVSLLSGCSTIYLNQGFHQPLPAPPSKAPVKIAVIFPQELKSTNFEVGVAGILFGMMNAYVYTEPGFSSALKSELASVFQKVKFLENPGQSEDADYIVHISTMFPSMIALSFIDAHSGKLIAKYQEPAVPVEQLYDTSTPLLVAFMDILMLGVLPIIVPVFLGTKGEGDEMYRSSVQASLSAALHKIALKIRAEQRVTETLAAAAARKSLEARGDRAAAKGDGRAALNLYGELLRNTWFGGDVDARVREKGLKILAESPIRVEVSREAKRHMVRGQYLVKEARKKASYGEATKEMEAAVRLAPWWPAAYYNLGLTQATAEQYPAAIHNLGLYLAASPDAEDAEAVQRKIYELEAKQEKSGTAKNEAEEASEETGASQEDDSEASSASSSAFEQRPAAPTKLQSETTRIVASEEEALSESEEAAEDPEEAYEAQEEPPEAAPRPLNAVEKKRVAWVMMERKRAKRAVSLETLDNSEEPTEAQEDEPAVPLRALKVAEKKRAVQLKRKRGKVKKIVLVEDSDDPER